MVPEEIRDAIRGFIAETMMFRLASPLADSESLITSGILDSLSMLSLIGFLEQRFEISVSDEDVEPDNFGSVDLLTSYVSRKLSPSAQQVA